MTTYNENKHFEELRASTGVGSAIYVKDDSLGKFVIKFLTEKVPSPSGDVESLEVNITTSTAKTKISGKETLNDIEFDIFAHRDNLRMLEEMNGKSFEFITANHDFTGERFSGTLTYKNGERTPGDASRCTVKITPLSKSVYTDNILPLLAPTAKITSTVPSVVDLASKTGKIDIDVTTDPEDATITAKSEKVAICTVAVVGKKVTITGVAEGSAIVELTTAKEGCASMKRTILVSVPGDAR